MENRIYTKFQRHVNNSNEVVNADHINVVQQAVNEAESNIVSLRDYDFMDKVMTTFENNLYANSMFANEINDQEYIDGTLSKNISYINEERSIIVNNASGAGELITTTIQSSLGDGAFLNDFFLVVDQYVPVGASINYFLINQAGDKYPINPNTPKTPLHVYANITGFKIKAEMTKNALGETPKIFALAVLFFDSAVEAGYGLTNPDLQRFHKFALGLTVLFRDRAQEDRLVKIEEPGKYTELIYNDQGVLSKVVTHYEDDNVVVTDTLNYGPYLNSAGVTETLLLSILSESSVTQNGATGKYDYTFFDIE